MNSQQPDVKGFARRNGEGDIRSSNMLRLEDGGSFFQYSSADTNIIQKIGGRDD
jgi:hypothetical protein